MRPQDVRGTVPRTCPARTGRRRPRGLSPRCCGAPRRRTGGRARRRRVLLDHGLRARRAARAARGPRPQLPRLGRRARGHGARAAAGADRRPRRGRARRRDADPRRARGRRRRAAHRVDDAPLSRPHRAPRRRRPDPEAAHGRRRLLPDLRDRRCAAPHRLGARAEVLAAALRGRRPPRADPTPVGAAAAGARGRDRLAAACGVGRALRRRGRLRRPGGDARRSGSRVRHERDRQSRHGSASTQRHGATKCVRLPRREASAAPARPLGRRRNLGRVHGEARQELQVGRNADRLDGALPRTLRRQRKGRVGERVYADRRRRAAHDGRGQDVAIRRTARRRRPAVP